MVTRRLLPPSPSERRGPTRPALPPRAPPRPFASARLLFTGDEMTSIGPADLDAWLIALDSDLDVGMQVLEDALCNWQKSPREFVPFRG